MENTFRLWALKCDEGYIKGSGDQLITTAPLDKASVFPLAQLAEVNQLLEKLQSKGCPGIRRVQLTVAENEE